MKSHNRIRISLKSKWDENKVCKNPNKGWYLHYYDNSLTNYGAELDEGDYLEDFPGLNHIYLRLAWSYLEPEENKFNWNILDKVIEPWVARGYSVAFRITCKETAADQVFATPEWVKKAGAKGGFYPNPFNSTNNWEPDYGDTIFLEKLAKFHQVFAERYDGKPWIEYVDIGSYGDWGEGHTIISSKKDWPYEVLKAHVEIHQRYYKKSVLMINDDHAGCRYTDPNSSEKLLDFFVDSKLALRDDSLCVKIYSDVYGYSSLRFPEMFEKFWHNKPIDLELDHYSQTKEFGTWKQGLPFIAAVEEAHATYMGFHGDARQFLRENPEVANRLANRCGYWYFINFVEIPEMISRGTEDAIDIGWSNLGVAPAYYHYIPVVMLCNKDSGKCCYMKMFKNSDNRKWLPGTTTKETYVIDIPAYIEGGNYTLRVALMESSDDPEKYIELGLKDSIKGKDGFYDIAEIEIE